MATIVKTFKWDSEDRENEYEAVLRFQTASNTFKFDIGDGREPVYLSLDAMYALTACLKQMSYRVELIGILDPLV